MITYTCPKCGTRTMGKGGKPWPCTGCGQMVDSPARADRPKRAEVAEMLGQFFAKVDPQSLQDQADQGVPLTRKLFASMDRMRLFAARGYLGQDGMAYVRSVDDDEADAMIDEMFRFAPDQAVVFWSHPEWARRELLSAKQILVA